MALASETHLCEAAIDLGGGLFVGLPDGWTAVWMNAIRVGVEGAVVPLGVVQMPMADRTGLGSDVRLDAGVFSGIHHGCGPLGFLAFGGLRPRGAVTILAHAVCLKGKSAKT